MAYIWNKIIEYIKKLLRSKDIGCDDNYNEGHNKEEYSKVISEEAKMIDKDMSLKEKIHKLIKDNEKYFVSG